MDALDYWRLCGELSVIQAALLAVGLDPSELAAKVENSEPHNRPAGYEAAKTAIYTAVRNGEIEGYWAGNDLTPDLANLLGSTPEFIALEKSWVTVASLRNWLTERGVKTGFFFPDRRAEPDFLNPLHSRYAPKLAAAVKAWLAMETEPLNGRSPKKALIDWLRDHAADFGLNDGDDKTNETGIEEISKVANWRLGGGAPKTPNS